MRTIETDVVVVGAGTAGLAAYRATRASGARAVIVEGGPYGTTCARVGCMPSKLLIAAAGAVHATGRFERFGVRLDGSIKVDGRAVMARVKSERDRFVGFVVEGVEKIPPADRIRGYGRFTAPDRLRVGDDVEITFSRAVIATGSSPAVPGFLNAVRERVIVNDDVFDWDDLPASVAVFGAGVIGLELGQALSRLGVKVHLFSKGGLIGPLTDPQVNAYAARTFGAEFALDADADVTGVEHSDRGAIVRYRNADGREQRVEVEWIIAATGRTPNLKNLGVETTGVALDARGLPVYDRNTLQCGDRPIFIAGDANADVPLLHEAADEGRIAGENAGRFPAVRPGLRRAGLGIVFSDPQIAIVGSRHASLRAGSFVTGEVSFEDQGRSRVMLRNRGLAHVYADAHTGRLLGAEIMGPDAEHLGHLLAWALQLNLTVAQILELPFYHPVVEEGLRTALRDAQAKIGAAVKLAA